MKVNRTDNKTHHPTSAQRFQYGYDADSNVLYRDDLVNTTDSQVYGYDGLNRLTGFTQATINGTFG